MYEDDDLFGDNDLLAKLGYKKPVRLFDYNLETMSQQDMINKLGQKLVNDEDIEEQFEKDKEGFKDLVNDALDSRTNDYSLFHYLLQTAPFITYSQIDNNTKMYLENYVTWLMKTKKPEMSDIVKFFIDNSFLSLVEIYLGKGGLATQAMVDKASQMYKSRYNKQSKIILNLLKNNFEWVESNYFKKKVKLCMSDGVTIDNLLEPLISYEYKIAIPCFYILPKTFKPEFLSNLPTPTYDLVKSTINSSNYFEELNSVVNDNKFIFDLEWIQECNKYLNELSVYDKFTVYGYTHKGDELTHGYILNPNGDVLQKIKDKKEDDPKFYFCYFFQTVKVVKDLSEQGVLEQYIVDEEMLAKNDVVDDILGDDIEKAYSWINLPNIRKSFSNEFWILVIKQFADDLKRIIQNSPPIKKTSYVYRGVKTQYYSMAQGDTFKSSTFLSTAFDPKAAYNFSSDSYCCLKKIILEPGTRAIVPEFLTQHPGEQEILLNIDSQFEILDNDMKHFTVYGIPKTVGLSKFQKSSACEFEMKQKLITTMRLIL